MTLTTPLSSGILALRPWTGGRCLTGSCRSGRSNGRSSALKGSGALVRKVISRAALENKDCRRFIPSGSKIILHGKFGGQNHEEGPWHDLLCGPHASRSEGVSLHDGSQRAVGPRDLLPARSQIDRCRAHRRNGHKTASSRSRGLSGGTSVFDSPSRPSSWASRPTRGRLSSFLRRPSIGRPGCWPFGKACDARSCSGRTGGTNETATTFAPWSP